LDPSEVIDFSAYGLAPILAEGNTRFPVGAFDLRSHDDAYFKPGFTAGRIQLPGQQYASQGLLNARWIPPAKLEPHAGHSPPLPHHEPRRMRERSECAVGTGLR
jgi:hypothetical protein